MKKNKSILITGGCGFVGTNLAIYLQRELKKFSISPYSLKTGIIKLIFELTSDL